MARSPAPAPTEMVQKPTDEELVRAAERALSNQRALIFNKLLRQNLLGIYWL